MNVRALGVLVMAIVVDGTVSLICAHFKIGGTPSTFYSVTNTVPSTGWDVISSAASWFGRCLTFSMAGFALLSLFIWLMNIFAFIGIVLIIRQGN